MRLPTLRQTVALDALVHVVAAMLLAVLAPGLAAAAGLAASWPVWLIAGAFAVFALENWIAARRPTSGLVASVVAADVLFVVGVVGLWVADPAGVAGWLRWALLALAVPALLMAALKTHGIVREPEAGRRTPGHGPTASDGPRGGPEARPVGLPRAGRSD